MIITDVVCDLVLCSVVLLYVAARTVDRDDRCLGRGQCHELKTCPIQNTGSRSRTY